MGQIRTLLLDFGGVVAEEGFREGLYALAAEHGLDREALFAAGHEAVYASGYVIGAGTEAAFWQRLRERFPLSGGDAALAAPILERFRLRPRVLERVRRLRAGGVVCALVSDQTDWLERLDARDRFYGEFDRVFNSYRLGLSKRNARLFDRVLAELGAVPETTLFLDDSPDNVERARSRGLRALCCDSGEGCIALLDELPVY